MEITIIPANSIIVTIADSKFKQFRGTLTAWITGKVYKPQHSIQLLIADTVVFNTTKSLIVYKWTAKPSRVSYGDLYFGVLNSKTEDIARAIHRLIKYPDDYKYSDAKIEDILCWIKKSKNWQKSII